MGNSITEPIICDIFGVLFTYETHICLWLLVKMQIVGGDEWLGRKEIFEIDGVRNGKKCKMVMLRNGMFLSFVKMICSGAEIHG